MSIQVEVVEIDGFGNFTDALITVHKKDWQKRYYTDGRPIDMEVGTNVGGQVYFRRTTAPQTLPRTFIRMDVFGYVYEVVARTDAAELRALTWAMSFVQSACALHTFDVSRADRHAAEERTLAEEQEDRRGQGNR